jgi:hypothetical protein
MIIKVTHPDKENPPRYATLWVNGVKLGEWYGGKHKKYLKPMSWALEMIPKRIKVIDRNIARLEKEINGFKSEKFHLLYKIK